MWWRSAAFPELDECQISCSFESTLWTYVLLWYLFFVCFVLIFFLFLLFFLKDSFVSDPLYIKDKGIVF